jgi:hypothetical protein
MSRVFSAGPRAGARAGGVVLRVVVAVGLAVDAYVHLHLAAGYDLNTAVVSEGALFRVEAALAAVAAVLVLVTRSRVAVVLAVLVAAGGVGAVLLYEYVDVGAVGPFPDMYEPISYPEKTDSLIAEAVAAVAAVAALAVLALGAGRTARGAPYRGRV